MSDTRPPGQLIVAGAGIGGLAAAISAARAGWEVRVIERASEFGEIGAGLQLGPNVTRLLHAWGLADALAAVAARPDALRVRSATLGRELARLDLATHMPARYGAPYLTLHRADLHAVLFDAARAQAAVALHAGVDAVSLEQDEHAARVVAVGGKRIEGDALVGADGLWSRVRPALLRDAPAAPTGHIAYRALVPQAALPAGMRSNDVTAWLGPQLHAITYPVRRGELLNLVVFLHGGPETAAEGWDHDAVAADLQAGLAPACSALRDLLGHASHWRQWVLFDRPPMRGPHEMARGRVALLGDAAHPMRPYLAQGAGMAIEDAWVLGQSLALVPELSVAEALGRYARLRWARAARVQARSRRNGRVFHLTGPVRVARDLSLRAMGAGLLDMPWLYGARL